MGKAAGSPHPAHYLYATRQATCTTPANTENRPPASMPAPAQPYLTCDSCRFPHWRMSMQFTLRTYAPYSPTVVASVLRCEVWGAKECSTQCRTSASTGASPMTTASVHHTHMPPALARPVASCARLANTSAAAGHTSYSDATTAAVTPPARSNAAQRVAMPAAARRSHSVLGGQVGVSAAAGRCQPLPRRAHIRHDAAYTATPPIDASRQRPGGPARCNLL